MRLRSGDLSLAPGKNKKDVARSTTPKTDAVLSPTTVATTPTPTSTLVPQGTGNVSVTGSNQPQTSSYGTKWNTVIILTTVIAIAGFFLIAVTLWSLVKCYRRRSILFSRGVTPIDDDEIETWKGRRTEEKGLVTSMGQPAISPTRGRSAGKGHQKSVSMASIRKPPSMIVYARPSEELSPIAPATPATPRFALPKRNFDGGGGGGGGVGGGKHSLDREPPFSPIQARAPNAREGLTDQAIPGDEPFVGSPKRHGSRLSKQISISCHPHQAHARKMSSRSSSSLRRLGSGERVPGYESDDYRPSHELSRGHLRVPSAREPPRPLLSKEWAAGGAARPFVRADEIGRAIG